MPGVPQPWPALLAAFVSCCGVGCGNTAKHDAATGTDGSSPEPIDATPDAGAESDGGADAGNGDDSNACASCASTLEQLCSGDSGLECPPDLGSSGFFNWAQRQIGFDWYGQDPWRPPLCSALTTCPEAVRVAFGTGADSVDEFLFDVATKKLIAVIGSGNSSSCVASAGCLPNRCVPLGPWPGEANSPACPALPDAGLDANAGSSCSIPVSANTYSSATDSGCQAFAQFCAPPCAPACPSGHYQLLCSAPGTVDAAPVPVAALNCTTDGDSQPSNTVEYCCQCLP
jgi:hypothetical protein